MVTEEPLPLTVNISQPIFLEWVLLSTLIVGLLAIGLAIGAAALAAYELDDDKVEDSWAPLWAALVTFLAVAAIGITIAVLAYGIAWQRYRNITGRG